MGPPRGEPRLVVNAARLWSGGVATAVVAALVALVGVLVCEGALGLDMAAPPLLPIGSSFAVRLVSSVLSRTTRVAWAGEAHG